MKIWGMAILIGAGCVGLLAGMTLPVTMVEVKGVHLCCGGCEGAATGAVNGAGGKDAKADKGSKTVTFSAANPVAAQKALDALATAGFYGEVTGKEVAFKDDSGTALPPKAKPVMITSGTWKIGHNCCDGCNKPLKEAITKVTGVTSEDCKAKELSFTVKGNYNPADLVKALHEIGYHVKLDKVNK